MLPVIVVDLELPSRIPTSLTVNWLPLTVTELLESLFLIIKLRTWLLPDGTVPRYGVKRLLVTSITPVEPGSVKSTWAPLVSLPPYHEVVVIHRQGATNELRCQVVRITPDRVARISPLATRRKIARSRSP